MLVTRRNVFHAACFMVSSLVGVAGLYVLLESPLLASVQLFIYVGGISIPILFVTTLTRDKINPDVTARNRQWPAAALVSAILCGILVWVAITPGWTTIVEPVRENSVAVLAQALVDPARFAFPLQIALVLLLIALFGAVTIVKER